MAGKVNLLSNYFERLKSIVVLTSQQQFALVQMKIQR